MKILYISMWFISLDWHLQKCYISFQSRWWDVTWMNMEWLKTHFHCSFWCISLLSASTVVWHVVMVNISHMACKLSYMLLDYYNHFSSIFAFVCPFCGTLTDFLRGNPFFCLVITIISKNKGIIFSLKTLHHKPCHSNEHLNSLFSDKNCIKNLNSAWTEKFNGADELMLNSLYRHRAYKWHSEL